MSKPKKQHIRFKVELDFSFYSFPTKRQNTKALNQIKRLVRYYIGEAMYSPIFVDKDENGAWIEDAAKVRLLSIKKIK